jgi:hypothetical protein
MLPGTDIPITIEAASYRGRPVMFQIVYPWTPATREPGRTGGSPWIFVTLALAGAAIASYVNLRRGRADRRGAVRIASFMVLVLVAGSIAGPHVSSAAVEQERFFDRTGLALFVGLVSYLLYIGLEPFVRRLWPSMLVASTRVLSGRLRDPLIGRDALVAVAAGAALWLLGQAPFVMAPLTGTAPAPSARDLSPLLGLRGVMSSLVQAVNNGIQNTLVSVFVYAGLRAVFERVTRAPIGASGWTIAARMRMSVTASDYVFMVCVLAVTAFNASTGGSGAERAINSADAVLSVLLILLVTLRIGIFACAIMFFTSSVFQRMPMTFDSASLYAAGSWIALALLLGIAVAGFRLASERARPAV